MEKNKCRNCGKKLDKKHDFSLERDEDGKRVKLHFCSLECLREWTNSRLSEPLEKQVQHAPVDEKALQAAEAAEKKEEVSDSEYPKYEKPEAEESGTSKGKEKEKKTGTGDYYKPGGTEGERAEGEKSPAYPAGGEEEGGEAVQQDSSQTHTSEHTVEYSEDLVPLKMPYWRDTMEKQVEPRRIFLHRETEPRDLYLEEFKEKSRKQSLASEQKTYDEKKEGKPKKGEERRKKQQGQ